MQAWILASLVASPPPPPAPDVPVTVAPLSDPATDRADRERRLARLSSQLRRREKNFFIAGGVIGGLGTIGHIVSSVFVGLEFTTPCKYSDDCYPEVSLLGDLGATVPMATGAALMGAGFGLRGRRHAYEDAIGGPGSEPRMKRRGVLGWTLFGVGLAMYVATRPAVIACPTDGCFVGVWEGGFWASAGLVSAGLVMGPYARGYNVGEKRVAVQSVAVAPFSDRLGVRGVAVSGRF